MKHLFLLLFLYAGIVLNAQKSKTYNELLQDVAAKRQYYDSVYDTTSNEQKHLVVKAARNYLLSSIVDEVFPHWYGTQWDFNGITRIPGEGYIACGYFITTVMEAVGFKIPRYKWAQLSAEGIIKKISPEDTKQFWNRPVSEVESFLLQKGNGIYVVGLDCHVGFIVVENGICRFVHSSYYKPEIGVLSESFNGNNPFAHSSVRLIGNLLTDEMVVVWIKGIEKM